MPTSSLDNQSSEVNLYETAFYRWLERTIKNLREGKFEQLDRANLIEELENMGRSEKHSPSLKPYYQTLLNRCL